MAKPVGTFSTSKDKDHDSDKREDGDGKTVERLDD